MIYEVAFKIPISDVLIIYNGAVTLDLVFTKGIFVWLTDLGIQYFYVLLSYLKYVFYIFYTKQELTRTIYFLAKLSLFSNFV